MKITGHALVDLILAPLHLGDRHIAVPIIHRLELATVDRDTRFGQQTKHPAKIDKLSTDLADGFTVILPKLGNRLVIGLQTAGQPHYFHIATGFAFKPTA